LTTLVDAHPIVTGNKATQARNSGNIDFLFGLAAFCTFERASWHSGVVMTV
jgi:hypothetical protein